MKPSDILIDQHRLVEDLIDQLENAKDPSRRERVRDRLAQNLVAHMIIEEQGLYPSSREALTQKFIVDEAIEEHLAVKLALQRLLEASVDDDNFMAKVHVLRDLLSHHVDEEEGEMLPLVEKAMEPRALDELTRQMQLLFDQAIRMDAKAILAGYVRAVVMPQKPRSPVKGKKRKRTSSSAHP